MGQHCFIAPLQFFFLQQAMVKAYLFNVTFIHKLNQVGVFKKVSCHFCMAFTDSFVCLRINCLQKCSQTGNKKTVQLENIIYIIILKSKKVSFTFSLCIL